MLSGEHLIVLNQVVVLSAQMTKVKLFQHNDAQPVMRKF